MLLLGHRGARNDAPENTIDAFELALQHGCDGFEFDVRLTLDHHAAICHDRHYHHLEVASSNFSSLLARGVLPSLEYALAQFHARAFLYIELKVPGIEQITVEAIKSHPPQHGYVVASFLPEVVTAMHTLDSSIPLGIICGRAHEFAAWPKLPVHYVMPRYTLVTRKLIEDIHTARKSALVWTVNRTGDMRRMAEFGVDGIVSDDTALLCRMFRGRTQTLEAAAED